MQSVFAVFGANSASGETPSARRPGARASGRSGSAAHGLAPRASGLPRRRVGGSLGGRAYPGSSCSAGGLTTRRAPRGRRLRGLAGGGVGVRARGWPGRRLARSPGASAASSLVAGRVRLCVYATSGPPLADRLLRARGHRRRASGSSAAASTTSPSSPARWRRPPPGALAAPCACLRRPRARLRALLGRPLLEETASTARRARSRR